ncbi:MAG: hypothetical protein LBE10_11815 [Treponema sp.]|nr:hypothetical protein [Treponema sp.]
MNDLVNFTYEGQKVRTIIKNGEPQWVTKDVAEVLGYPETTISNTAKIVQHVPDEWKGRYPIPTLGGEQEMICLSEPGLYFFLALSDKPAALPLILTPPMYRITP